MSFGFGAASAPSTTFGGFGSSFSTPSTSFSSSSFSQPQSTSTFGQSLFGSSSSASNAGGGFSFGSSSAFGSASTAASTSGFGGGGGFGASTGSTFGGFGSFGSTQQPTQPAQSTFGFGASSAFPAASNSASSFASNPFSSFGAQPQAGSSNVFGAQPSQQQQAQQQLGQQSQAADASSALLKQLLELKASYDPSSPLCRFQAVFYNRVADPSKLKSFVPPPHANPALYQRALRSNPDPSSLTPSLAVGFEDLKRRLEAQREARAVHEAAVKGIKDSVEEMRSVHWAYTLPLLKALRDTGDEQSLRVVRLVNRVLALEARGLPLMDEEREYCAQVERMAVEVQRQGWMEKAREMQRRVRMGGGGTGEAAKANGGGGELQWSEEEREKLRRVIETQTKALEFLVDVVKEDRKLLQTVATADAGAEVAQTAHSRQS